jgi:ankyrin repeat protein
LSSPLHAACLNAKEDVIKLLLKYPSNKADVNAENKMGLTPIHILLAKLLDSALLQNKPANSRPSKMLNLFKYVESLG